MQNSFHKRLTFLLVLFCLLKAGLYPASIASPAFACHGQSTISAVYPLLVDLTTVSGWPTVEHIANANSLQSAAFRWVDLPVGHAELIPALNNKLLTAERQYIAAAGFIVPALEPVRIIFPFHEFW